MQDHDAALPLGEEAEGIAYVSDHLRGHGRRPPPHPVGRAVESGVRGRLGPASALAQPAGALAADDGVEPLPQPGAIAERTQRPEGVHEGLLHDVLRRVGLAGDVPSDVIKARAVAHHEPVEGLDVASGGPLHQLVVGEAGTAHLRVPPTCPERARGKIARPQGEMSGERVLRPTPPGPRGPARRPPPPS